MPNTTSRDCICRSRDARNLLWCTTNSGRLADQRRRAMRMRHYGCVAICVSAAACVNHDDPRSGTDQAAQSATAPPRVAAAGNDAVATIDLDAAAAKGQVLSTISVGLIRAGTAIAIDVPRSSVDGFDYDPAANTTFSVARSFPNSTTT